ncbi:RING/FYVE/PHD zinc finger superfamily protein isoform 1 [Dorcoceras hygrometricum]|uniref:RING/FYVE/PHD zinc finger superfamily protein isoform 1 n=1 Tax=Dorcoceras hygrometricum TaxID=472368 RepID=A0A2Z7BW12_9LAMI|nr:RING/FYVE/PHD zinc finger superfamily protein isoform 1 [Dorcoceras hygrometricum]
MHCSPADAFHSDSSAVALVVSKCCSFQLVLVLRLPRAATTSGAREAIERQFFVMPAATDHRSEGVGSVSDEAHPMLKSGRIQEQEQENENICVLRAYKCLNMDSDLVIYRTTLVRTFQVVTICRVESPRYWLYRLALITRNVIEALHDSARKVKRHRFGDDQMSSCRRDLMALKYRVLLAWFCIECENPKIQLRETHLKKKKISVWSTQLQEKPAAGMVNPAAGIVKPDAGKTSCRKVKPAAGMVNPAAGKTSCGNGQPSCRNGQPSCRNSQTRRRKVKPDAVKSNQLLDGQPSFDQR